jgi:adenosylcobinamide-GDP ribazoletransferase
MASESSSPTTEEEPPRLAEQLQAALRELRAALLFLTGVGPPPEGEQLARGGMFFPLVGLALGAVAAGIALLARATLPPLLAAIAVLVWLCAVGRGAQPLALARGVGDRLGARFLGWIVLAGLLAAKLAALEALGEHALGISLMLASMLGRWALVVQAYGSIPVVEDRFAAALTRGLKFREFGTASVSAMALTLVLANAVGLVLLLAVAALSIALRIAAHRRSGGVSRTSILSGGELAETTALLACAALARLIAGG